MDRLARGLHPAQRRAAGRGLDGRRRRSTHPAADRIQQRRSRHAAPRPPACDRARALERRACRPHHEPTDSVPAAAGLPERDRSARARLRRGRRRARDGRARGHCAAAAQARLRRRTYWKYRDDHWAQTRALAALPFLTQIADCFAAGLYAAARWRRRGETRTILIERPRLRLANGRLHRANEPAVVWPDGSGRWYWQGIAVPAKLAANRDNLNAEQIARIDNQELRRVALERLGWQRFLETADAELRAQDDYGKLWSTQIRLDGERAQVVEVVNATPEPDGSYRRYFLRVPPAVRTAREAVAWTFGFDDPNDYLLAAES